MCGLPLLGDLQPIRLKPAELAWLDGWDDDIESLTPEAKARRFAASLVVLSENRARQDVRVAFGIVTIRFQLERAFTPNIDCK